MKKLSTKDFVLISLLIGLNIVLSRFLSINAWNIKIGFTFVTIYVASYMYGPIIGGLVGGFGDLIGALLFPIGPYFPGFSFTAVLVGILFGVLLKKSDNLPRIIITCLLSEFILSLFLNTFWIHVLYNANYLALLATRVVQSAVMTFVEIITIKMLVKALPQLERRMK